MTILMVQWQAGQYIAASDTEYYRNVFGRSSYNHPFYSYKKTADLLPNIPFRN